MIIMDTHRAVEKIMVAGLSKEAAEAIVDTVNTGSDDLVTKKDLKLSISELKNEIDNVRNELKNEISTINTNINWLKTIAIANFTVVIGTAIAALFK